MAHNAGLYIPVMMSELMAIESLSIIDAWLLSGLKSRPSLWLRRCSLDIITSIMEIPEFNKYDNSKM